MVTNDISVFESLLGRKYLLVNQRWELNLRLTNKSLDSGI